MCVPNNHFARITGIQTRRSGNISGPVTFTALSCCPGLLSWVAAFVNSAEAAGFQRLRSGCHVRRPFHQRLKSKTARPQNSAATMTVDNDGPVLH